jgi:hypothetical protein
MDIQTQITSLLERRRQRLPLVKKEVERWQQLDQEIALLNAGVDELRNYPRAPAEVKQGLAGFQTEEIRKDIAAAIGLLRILETRYARPTINIGVSGSARMGKSTLLQSISGLQDEQIPTGSGIPVTAVRSKIFYSKLHQRATLVLHDFVTFRGEILGPYHTELGLPPPPLSIDAFRSWPYPAAETELGPEYRDKHSSVTLLKRLKVMQESLPSYENDLVGGERTVLLDDLRQYVAYPTNEQADTSNCPRRYLAVRNVRIECAFPYAQVNEVGIIDLPGLGELAANTEEHHLAGLRDEVDIVLLVKRPVESMAYWRREDGAAIDLLDKARGFIQQRRDFVFIILNMGDTTSELEAALRDSVRREANEGIDGKHFQVLEGDGKDQQSVAKTILTPVLAHLAERLPVMDDEVFEGTKASYGALTVKVKAALRDLESALGAASRSSGSTREGVLEGAKCLREELSEAFFKIVDGLKTAARSREEDMQFVAAVDSAYGEIQTWIENGFGRGKEKWCALALRKMRVDGNFSPFAAVELNRIRVEISQCYCSLDHYFQGRVEELWNDSAQVFTRHLGELLGAAQGIEALRLLEKTLFEASEPCPTLSKAVRNLIELKLEYRTHLHPRVREELDGLNLEVDDPEAGGRHNQIEAPPISEAGAETLFRNLSQLAEQAAYRTKKALMGDASTPALVLYAAAEQFEDALIRSGASENEFQRLAFSFRDEIWPNEYEGIDEANAKFAKVKRAIDTVRKHLGDFERRSA